MKALALESTAPFQGLPELVAYDGNMYFRVLWGDLRSPTKTAPDIVSRLTAVARNTMGKLKT